MPAHALAEQLGIQYVAARRVRKLVLTDLAPGEGGILRNAVFILTVSLPTGIEKNSVAHLMWLIERSFVEAHDDS